MGREKIVLYSEIAGAIVDLFINILLIPRMAATGAAIGTLIAELAVWIVQFVALRYDIIEAYKKVKYFAIILGIIIASMLSIWIKLFRLGSFITLVLTAIVFFGTYGVTLIIAKEPLVNEIVEQILKKILKKNR